MLSSVKKKERERERKCMPHNEISVAKRMKFYIRDEELSGTRSVQRFYDKERRQKPGKERKNEKRNERVIQLEGKRID